MYFKSKAFSLMGSRFLPFKVYPFQNRPSFEGLDVKESQQEATKAVSL